MALLFNRVKVLTSTSGTGAVTLGSPAASAQSWANGGASNGDAIYYLIEDGATAWEIGVGTYSSAGPSISRDTVLASSLGGAKIPLSGSSYVSSAMPKEALDLQALGLSADGEALVTAADYAAMRSLLDLVPGVDVQEYSAQLDALAALVGSAGKLIQFTGPGAFGLIDTPTGDVVGPATNTANYVPQWDGANSKTLKDGIAIGAASATDLIDRATGDVRYQAASANLTTYAAIAPSSDAQAFLGADDYADMRTQLGLVIGTNVQAYDAGLASLASAATTDTFYYLSAADTWSPVTVGAGINFVAGTLSAAGSTSYAVVQEQKASGGASNNLSVSGWRNRDSSLVEVYDPDGIVSVSGGQFTLGAGTYRITAYGPISLASPGATTVRSRIYNATDAAAAGQEGPNTTAINAATDAVATAVQTTVDTFFTIAGTKAFNFQTYPSASCNCGIALSNGGVEIYSTIIITKLA